MATLTGKALLSLSRGNVAVLGLQKPVSRVTYATGLAVSSSKSNNGEFYCRRAVVHLLFRIKDVR